MAAEERLLEKDIPRNADEFEKLIRSSPNSSFMWIKYMAFVLSLADIEKARSIAERYNNAVSFLFLFSVTSIILIILLSDRILLCLNYDLPW